MKSNPYPGLKKVRGRKGAIYYYAWCGGPRLTEQFGSPAFARAYIEAVAKKVPAGAEGTLARLIAEYCDASDFQGLRERTRKDYARKLRLIENDFGTFPLGAAGSAKARAQFLKWRDKLAERSPKEADLALAVLARVFSWGKHRGLVDANPCEKPGRVYRGTRRERVWTPDDEAAFNAVASAPLRQALTLALWTGQRRGDLLGLRWAAYDGETIRLRQSKTGAAVLIPAGGPLRAMLDSMPRVAPTILASSDGTPWTGDGFATSWGKAAKRAGLDNLTFHDLRGTAVTRLAAAGCTPAEIGAITGHKAADVNAILERHYLATDPRLAQAAIRKLEKSHQIQENSPGAVGGETCFVQ